MYLHFIYTMGYYRKYRKKRYKKKSTAQRALYLARKVANQLNVEYKLIANQQSAVAVTNAGTFFNLTGIATGTTLLDRIGDSIRITRIQFRAIFQMSTTSTQAQGRILIVQDKQTNGLAFPLTELLEDTSGVDNIISYYVLDNNERFKVLYDKRVQWSNGGERVVMCDFFKDVSIPMRFSSNTGTIADQTTNSISLVYIGSEPINQPVLWWTSRIRFIDN